MQNLNKIAWLKANRHLWRISLIMVACVVIYYLHVFAGLLGWTSAQASLKMLHDFYGIDFYALVFFVPVVYAAYVFGVGGAVVVALVAMLTLVPYAILVADYANALSRPTAFAIILSAVGAAVAMLQKGDEQRHRSLNEIKCLYEVGKAAEESRSIRKFLSSVVALVPRHMPCPGETEVRVVVRDKAFQSPGFEESAQIVAEDLVVGGEVMGRLEIYCPHRHPDLKKPYPLVKTLAERIGGAIRRIELEQSLKRYSEHLEEMVRERTRDLEEAQGKLIRSERLAAVGELASGVGHELRNPLNVIRNCVYLLHMSLGEGAQEEILKTLKLLDQQVDISNKIVTDLLNFTRVSPPSLAPVELHGLVKESLSWVSVPEDVTVVTNFNGNSPWITADAEQLGRAFANVIANAVQAMNGKGELKINTGVRNGDVWVKFEDTGCGIAQENLEKIFEPLFTTKPKGIGLGLAITKKLVDQNGGSIEVSSQLNKGTTFAIKLPRREKEVSVAEKSG